MLSIALSGVRLQLLVVYWHTVRSEKGPIVLKALRRRRFACINMTVQPAWPVHRMQENGMAIKGVWRHF